MPDAGSLTPQDAPALAAAHAALRLVLQQSVCPCLLSWLRVMQEEAVAEEAASGGASSDAHVRMESTVHEHLVLLHANLQPHQASAATVSRVLSSLMFVVSHHTNASVHVVPLVHLFELLHRLRATLVDWLEADTRTDVERRQVLDATPFHDLP